MPNRHHVSVLSKRNHKQELWLGEDLVEGDRRERKSEVAVPGGGVADKEEEAGVPDPLMVSHIVAFGDEDVVVSGVAGTVVSVSVAEVEEEGGSVALVRLPGVKKRRLDESGGSLKVVEDLPVVKVPLGRRGRSEGEGRVASGVPTRPRGHVGPGFGMGPIRGGDGYRGYGGLGRGRGVATPGNLFSLPSGPVVRDRGNWPAGPSGRYR